MLALDVCRNAPHSRLDLTLAATGGGDLEADFQRSGVEYIRLQRRLPVDLRIVFALRRIIVERRIQVVHCSQAVEGIHAYLAALNTGCKRVLSFQGYAPDRKNLTALRFLAPRMHANIAVTHAFLQTLGTVEGYDVRRNFHVIPNSVDEERLRGGDAGKLRRELNLPGDALLLGMIGNFSPYAAKDQLTICRALPRVFASAPHAHCIFAGKRFAEAPHLYDDCVNYCREHGILERVHFLGKRADVADVLGALDLFVFSSLRDTFAIAVAEAMMMGVPVVACDIPPLVEVTGGGRYARIFRTGDADDLSKHLVELINDVSLRRELAVSARQWATTQFGIQAHLVRLTELYTKLLTEKPE